MRRAFAYRFIRVLSTGGVALCSIVLWRAEGKPTAREQQLYWSFIRLRGLGCLSSVSIACGSMGSSSFWRTLSAIKYLKGEMAFDGWHV
ncbi:MAG: hypothetical protein CMH50_04985 [Myxococcales bacterium]|nr:hypothetical protein [Myxococcales bacterium]